MGVAGSIFEPHPPNFGKSDIFWRSTNDITIIFRNFHNYKSCEKCTQARRPGVEESLNNADSLRFHISPAIFHDWTQNFRLKVSGNIFKSNIP